MAAGAATGPSSGPDAGVVAPREIARLVAAIGTSDCEFQRNGRWHAAADAQAHLQRKLERARSLGFNGTADDFIERLASRSSLSGRPYRVRCDGVEALAADWFTDELARMRAADSSRSPR
ncbi:hypothetical protein FZO89_01685 [Luteimonas viscosa]|uniref:Uncharacterized protein n=1 Tax=Luteimonas viscosa TaxID=1132694 RepID=A0A5D4XTW6_9GAMM|nr:hypothetical protein FZO89_01685 [Luteimonas viscosa]